MFDLAGYTRTTTVTSCFNNTDLLKGALYVQAFKGTLWNAYIFLLVFEAREGKLPQWQDMVSAYPCIKPPHAKLIHHCLNVEHCTCVFSSYNLSGVFFLCKFFLIVQSSDFRTSAWQKYTQNSHLIHTLWCVQNNRQGHCPLQVIIDQRSATLHRA